jgi:hypothetical protein
MSKSREMQVVSQFFDKVIFSRGVITVTDDRYFSEPLTLNYKKDIFRETYFYDIYLDEVKNDSVKRFQICEELHILAVWINNIIKPDYTDDDLLMYSYLDKDILKKLADDSGLSCVKIKNCKIVVDDHAYFRQPFEFYPLHFNCLDELLKRKFSDDEVFIKLGYLVRAIRNMHKNHKHEKIDKLPTDILII